MDSYPQYVKQSSINREKWDACIHGANNGLLYAKSFFLDHMANEWDALVAGDYEWVMPLTWRRKWGLRYLYQPAFTQQLGIFSASLISADLINAFLDVLKKEFSFAEIFLNFQNPGSFAAQPNFILPLDRPVVDIKADYNEELNRNLQYAHRFNLNYSTTKNYKETIRYYQEIYGARTPHVDDDDYGQFASLCADLNDLNQLLVKEVRDDDGELLASAIFGRDHRRLYYLLPVTWPQGRTFQANHFLIDQLISEFGGQHLILDFEGSTLPGVARFYRKFGAVDQPFFFFKYNRLPPPISWFKS